MRAFGLPTVLSGVQIAQIGDGNVAISDFATAIYIRVLPVLSLYLLRAESGFLKSENPILQLRFSYRHHYLLPFVLYDTLI